MDFFPDIPVTPYEQLFDPELFRAMIYGQVGSQRLRWWRAVIDPTFDRPSGMQNAPAGHEKWLREEQDIAQFCALIQGTQHAWRYLPQGEFETGDLLVTTMPDEIYLGDHDWVVALGKPQAAPGFPQTARLLQYKEPLIRGLRTVAQTGTVSSVGAALTGTGTAFLSTLQAGDVVKALAQSLRVVAVADDTHLTLEAAPSPAWTGNSFVKRVDTLLYWPVGVIEEIRDSTMRYTPGLHYQLGADEKTVQWLSGTVSPAPDAPYSVVYRYFPLYEVQGQQGSDETPMGTAGLPITRTLRLVKPETIRQ